METIISALISAGAGLLTVVITFNYKLKCIKDSVESANKLLTTVNDNKLVDLSKEIVEKTNNLSQQTMNTSNNLSKEIVEKTNDLSKEHSSLINNTNNILNSVSNVSGVVNDINTNIKEEKIKQKFRYDNLSNNKKEIVDSINKISDFSDKFQDVNSENVKLRQELESYKQKVQHLEVMMEELNQEKELEDELEMEN